MRCKILSLLICWLCVGLLPTLCSAQAKPPVKKPATEPEALKAPPGFKIELLHTADPATEGSWINLCVDGKGRLVIAGQRNQPILRATLQDGKVSKLEKLDLPISEAMGLLWAFDTLYVNGAGPQGFGLYRCYESPTTPGKFEQVKFLKAFQGSGEHGPHGLALGKDNKIYVMNGNHTKLPEGLSETSPHKNYREDHLLPRQWDGNGHATGILSPGGYVVRTDADGTSWDLMLAGFRNAYDLAFNGDGELFTFDSDMEWDWGMPWYRPTRVNHCTSASEFGWRSGTGKWPSYYEDSLPATVDIGVGSPTGVTFGTGAKFPEKYQKAFYICDWTYGRLIAVHLTPKGSSYTATYENFVAPAGLTADVPKKPLNLTDVVVGHDGAMYFTIGGRNTQGALYRVTYTGKDSTSPGKIANTEGAKERALRSQLEAYHGKVDPQAVTQAWAQLKSEDRFLRYAARLALESQPVATWQEKAVQETDPRAGLTALLALARTGDAKSQAALLVALEKFSFAKLPVDLQLTKLRVLGLSFIRQGRPSLETAKKLLAELDKQFPHADANVGAELAQVLISLHAPGIAARCLQVMSKAKTQEELFHYMFHLRTLPIGNWTIEQRREYLAYWTNRKKFDKHEELSRWFTEAGRAYGDGSSFNNFLKNFVKEASSNMSDAERTALSPVLLSIDKAAAVSYDIKPRPLVKAWKMTDLVDKLDNVDKGRNVGKGKEAYFAAQCIRCHRFGQEGGSVGPDLTAISARFSRKDLLESLVEPSKVLSDQYQNEQFETKSGKNVIGRVVDETADKLVIQPNPLEPDRIELKKSDIAERKPSKLSPMPANLIDVLTEEEIYDLLAFLESAQVKQRPAKK